MKLNILVCLFALGLLATTSCNDEDPVEQITYNLIVKNRSGVDLDIYIKSTQDNNYKSEGNVMDEADKTISNVIVNVRYTVGFIQAGGDPADITNEVLVINNDPDVKNYELTIN